jgi:hypothetical protein
MFRNSLLLLLLTVSGNLRKAKSYEEVVFSTDFLSNKILANDLCTV